MQKPRRAPLVVLLIGLVGYIGVLLVTGNATPKLLWLVVPLIVVGLFISIAVQPGGSIPQPPPGSLIPRSRSRAQERKDDGPPAT